MTKGKIVIEKNVFCLLIVFMIGTTITYTFWQNSLLVTALLTFLWGINAKYWHSKNDNILFILAFFGGPLAEINAIQLGIWSYSNPSFFGIPMWLPLLWAETAVAGKRFADVISQLL